MPKGKVKWFSDRKGFGFIETPEKPNSDVFVHYSCIEGEGYRSLSAGDDVEFEMDESDKGLKAKKVMKL
ncbi:MAG: cold shock domain-containing protein [Elusimicrobiota bacterium]